jgi:ribosomal protein L18E
MEKISKTKIERRMRSKSNPYLVEAIVKLKKENPQLAKLLAFPRRKQMSINLEALDTICKDNDKVIVPGKILGFGEFNKKIKVIAFSASESAIKKMHDAKSEFLLLNQCLEDSKKLNEYKIIR